MIRFTKTTRLAALALAGATLLTAVPASAHGWNRPGWGGPGWGAPGWGPRYYYGPRHNNNGAAVAAGIIGGLAVGALAANAANNYYRPRCWTETQTVYNRWGQPYYRDVEVCR